MFDPSDVITIKQAYAETVEFEYGEKRAQRNVSSLLTFIEEVSSGNKMDSLDEAFLSELRALSNRIRQLLGSIR